MPEIKHSADGGNGRRTATKWQRTAKGNEELDGRTDGTRLPRQCALLFLGDTPATDAHGPRVAYVRCASAVPWGASLVMHP